MKKNIFKTILLFSVLFTISCTSANVEDTQNQPIERKGKNYVGWVDTTGKDITYSEGILNIRVKQNLGTFNIGVINKNEKTIPVLANTQEFTSSPLYLKTSKKIYTLRNDGFIKTFASRTNNIVSLNYCLEKNFEVAVDFEFFKSIENSQTDMIKVTYTVKNLSQRKDDFALKAIYDTVLGESDQYHFYTSENVPIKNEVCYRTMQNQKWFTSKNKNATMQFLLNGADTTAPEVVALANYSTLQKNGWEPEMLSYRAFDTVLSYNNSAVGIIWPQTKLNPNESYKNIFYLAFASDDDKPLGHEYIFKPEENEEQTEKGTETKIEINTKKIIEPVEELPPYIEPEIILFVPPTPIPELKPVIEETPPPVPVVKEEPKIEPKQQSQNNSNDDLLGGLKPEQLTVDYIQKLIDRISLLEQDSSTLNAQELVDLNTELDLILSVLR